jgi:hypothetical protein
MHPPARTVCAALLSATRTLGIEGVRPYRRSRRSSASERALVHGDTELYDPFDGRAAAGVEVAANAPGLARHHREEALGIVCAARVPQGRAAES